MQGGLNEEELNVLPLSCMLISIGTLYLIRVLNTSYAIREDHPSKETEISRFFCGLRVKEFTTVIKEVFALGGLFFFPVALK